MFDRWDIQINLWDLADQQTQQVIEEKSFKDEQDQQSNKVEKKLKTIKLEPNIDSQESSVINEDIILKQLASKKKKKKILKFVFFSFIFVVIILAGIWIYIKKDYVADILWLKKEVVKTVIKEKIEKVNSEKQSKSEEISIIPKSSFTWDVQSFYSVYLQDYNLLVELLKNYSTDQKKKLLIRYNLIVYDLLKNKDYLSFKKNYINFWYKILKKSWKNKK